MLRSISSCPTYTINPVNSAEGAWIWGKKRGLYSEVRGKVLCLELCRGAFYWQAHFYHLHFPGSQMQRPSVSEPLRPCRPHVGPGAPMGHKETPEGDPKCSCFSRWAPGWPAELGMDVTRGSGDTAPGWARHRALCWLRPSASLLPHSFQLEVSRVCCLHKPSLFENKHLQLALFRPLRSHSSTRCFC